MTRYIAFDPGTTTGVAVLHQSSLGGVESLDVRVAELGPEPHHERIERYCYRSDVIICEDFTFRPNPTRRKIVLDSVEYIGVAKLVAAKTQRELIIQQPNQGKAFWDDTKVKKLGLWVPGKKHAMDATRHLLYYLVFNLKWNWILEGLKKT